MKRTRRTLPVIMHYILDVPVSLIDDVLHAHLHNSVKTQDPSKLRKVSSCLGFLVMVHWLFASK